MQSSEEVCDSAQDIAHAGAVIDGWVSVKPQLLFVARVRAFVARVCRGCLAGAFKLAGTNFKRPISHRRRYPWGNTTLCWTDFVTWIPTRSTDTS